LGHQLENDKGQLSVACSTPEEVHSLFHNYNIKMTNVVIETGVHSANSANFQWPDLGRNLKFTQNRRIGERSMSVVKRRFTGLFIDELLAKTARATDY
jgi:hypothetical protein